MITITLLSLKLITLSCVTVGQLMEFKSFKNLVVGFLLVNNCMIQTTIELNKFYSDDCFNILPHIKTDSVDSVITDPPFALNFNGRAGNYNRKTDNVIKKYGEIAYKDYFPFIFKLCLEAKRVLKDTGGLWLFSGWNNLDIVLKAIKESGLHLQHHVIWKYNFGVFTKKIFVTSHYHLLFAVKNPKKHFFHKYYWYPEDVWMIKKEYQHGGKKAPTKLPKEIVQRILLYGTKEGDVILDPCAGSGTTLYVAKMMKRNFIGIELIEEISEIALDNIRNTEWGDVSSLPEQGYGYPYLYYHLKKKKKMILVNVRELKRLEEYKQWVKEAEKNE